MDRKLAASSQFHQHFVSSFSTEIFLPENFKAKLYTEKGASEMFMELTPRRTKKNRIIMNNFKFNLYIGTIFENV